MSKAADAFRTISEVAAELAVPKHVLRFWEAKFPQIRPMKRGGGRRYYRPSDMELLRGIRHLLHAEGYTIKGVQKILREHGIDAVKQYAEASEAVEARSRRSSVRQQAPASTSSAVVAIPSAASGSGAPTGRALLQQMLSELEACRKLLVADAGAAQQERPARRARTARG